MLSLVNRSKRRGLAAVAVATLSLGTGAALHADPAHADPGATPSPTVGSVTEQLTALGRKAETLSEKYNAARINLSTARHRAATAERTSSTAAAQYRNSRIAFVQQVQADYSTADLGGAGALLASRSSADYLQRLSSVELLEQQSATVVQRMETEHADATDAATKADAAVRKAAAANRSVTAKRDAVAKQTSDLESLLATLTARERAEFAQRNAVSAQRNAVSAARATTLRAQQPAAAPTQPTPKRTKLRHIEANSPAAQKAVDFAMNQLGKPYSFGADGPGSYDCSGLTMAAWRAAGVSLPHLASAQINYGQRVTPSELAPGDLVFMYNPIGHVSIYIGNGNVISAPQAGENVKIVSFAHQRSQFAGASRPG